MSAQPLDPKVYKGGNTIKGKPKRLHRVDVVSKIDPQKSAGTQHFTIALCLGLRGEIYFRVATYGEWVTKRIPTNVPQLRRLLGMCDGDWHAGMNCVE